MGIRKHIEDFGGYLMAQLVCIPADQSLAETDQVVANIDCGCRAMLPMKSFAAVAIEIVVFDIIVYQ